MGLEQLGKMGDRKVRRGVKVDVMLGFICTGMTPKVVNVNKI